jgi:magnesium-protoporphyrin O-methyltransferase
MSSCCSGFCSAVRSKFDASVAEGDLRRYRRKGPNPTTRILLDLIRQHGAGNSVLDVGAGIGALSLELLASGFRQATAVDAAPAYLAAARSEADRQGRGAALKLLEGDFVELAATVESADVVVMDRVVCCYPEFAALLSAALTHSRRWFAMSYPRDRWDIRLVVKGRNAMRGWRGNPFRSFVHPVTAMDALAGRQGFRRVAHAGTFVWAVALYTRNDT